MIRLKTAFQNNCHVRFMWQFMLCFPWVLVLSWQISAQPADMIQSTDIRHSEHLGTEELGAQQWELDHAEWERYRLLMQGIRGSISPATLSPIEVLGIHARNVGERRRYAEQWARMMREDAARILAFQLAYDDAQRRLFPAEDMIDAAVLAAVAARSPINAYGADWQPGDRVLMFIATDCSVCDVDLTRLLGELPRLAGLDLYLMDVAVGEEARIREWARARQINPDLVSDRKVTLNINGGALEQVIARTGQPSTSLPILALRRGKQLLPLTSSTVQGQP